MQMFFSKLSVAFRSIYLSSIASGQIYTEQFISLGCVPLWKFTNAPIVGWLGVDGNILVGRGQSHKGTFCPYTLRPFPGMFP